MRLLRVALLLALLLPAESSAHDLAAECKLKDGLIHVSVFFDDDAPAVHARIEVLDSQNAPIATGKADARGLWSFPAPAAGAYTVIVDGGMGHRARIPFAVPWNLPVVAASSAGASSAPLGPYISAAIIAGKKPPSVHSTPEPTPEGGIVVSPGTRAELTRFPYLKVGVGLGAIVVFSAAFLVARSRSGKKKQPT